MGLSCGGGGVPGQVRQNNITVSGLDVPGHLGSLVCRKVVKKHDELFVYLPHLLEKPYEGLRLCSQMPLHELRHDLYPDDSCLLGWESDADLAPVGPEPPAVLAAGSQLHACLVLCQYRNPLQIFP